MKLPQITVAIFMMFCGYSSALEVNDLVRCKEISADGPRLACFDAITAKEVITRNEVLGAKRPDTETGSWDVMVDIDPITDEKVLTIALESELRTSTFRPPTLIIRCKSKTPEVFISWNEYLSDESLVTVRIGDDSPKTSRWSESTDQTATFALEPVEFLTSIRLADELSARITPYRSGPITANFSISGLNTILTEHHEVCGLT